MIEFRGSMKITSTPPFTKSEIDYLVKEAKYINEIPPPQDRVNDFRVQAQVYRVADKKPIKGLFVMATYDKPLPGMSGKIQVSAALDYKGLRIRGIDKELWHDNPDGSSVRGWHEHLWSPEYLDAYVAPFPEPRHKTIRALFEAGLKRWNIIVVREQLRLSPNV